MEDSLSLCRSFGSTVRCMMYGFGDDQNPYTESVDILEDLVIEFITEMVGHGTGMLLHDPKLAEIWRLPVMQRMGL